MLECRFLGLLGVGGRVSIVGCEVLDVRWIFTVTWWMTGVGCWLVDVRSWLSDAEGRMARVVCREAV